jgi:putative oxidoreductase
MGSEWVQLVLRLVVGAVFVGQGYDKFVWTGFKAFSESFVKWGFPFPGLCARAVGTFELIGGILLIVGLFVRSIAILFIVQMVVAWYVSFFIVKKPFLSIGRPGWDVIVLLTAGAFSLVLNGGGKFAFDAVLAMLN